MANITTDAYQKKTWTANDIVTADDLNNIENGININIDEINGINGSATYLSKTEASTKYLTKTDAENNKHYCTIAEANRISSGRTLIVVKF